MENARIVTEEEAEHILSQLVTDSNIWHGEIISKAQRIRDICIGIATGLFVNYLGGTSLNEKIVGVFGTSIGLLVIPFFLNQISAINRNVSIANFKNYMIKNFQNCIKNYKQMVGIELIYP